MRSGCTYRTEIFGILISTRLDLERHAYPWAWTVVSASLHYKNPTQRVGLVKSGHHHHLIKKVTCSRYDIAEK